jgi:indole-3-glycerol phosphate synthase
LTSVHPRAIVWFTEQFPKPHVSRRIPEVQVATPWTPPAGTLGELIAAARIRAARLKTRQRELEGAASRSPVPPSFARALRCDTVAVIAEVKRRSPSQGDINPTLDAADQSAAYAAGGAAAVSVLTEPERFGGTLDDLATVRRRVALPVLRKDFLVDSLQLVESRAWGASAALVIVRAVDPVLFTDLLATGRAIGLDLLVEVHTEAEAERALAGGATVIGVNNRDLETLEVDPTLAVRIIPQLPRGVVAIAESGIASLADVETVAAAGADAVLVGTVLSGAADAPRAVRSLCGVAREPARRR